MFAIAPLLAQRGFDWIGVVIFIIFFVIPLVSQIVQNFGKADPKRQEAKRQAQRPGQAPRDRPADPLDNEIEDFLKQAGRRQAQAAPAKPRPARPAPRPRPRPAEVVEAEPVRRTLTKSPLDESVADHVRNHIESAPISAPSAELGRLVGNADEKLESRLHSVFDHELGSLGKKDSSQSKSRIREGSDDKVWDGLQSTREQADRASALRASEMREMLSNPVNIRQAIIWSEILTRPDERII